MNLFNFSVLISLIFNLVPTLGNLQESPKLPLSISNTVNTNPIRYNRFLDYVDEGLVKKVDLIKNENIIQAAIINPDLGNRLQVLTIEAPTNLDQSYGSLTLKLRNANIDFAIIDKTSDLDLIKDILPLILLLGINIFLFISQFNWPSKNKKEEKEVVSFDNVAGVDEAKVELMEVVEFLKTPDKFTKVGARPPKGILLVGPPGTGKTLLAKAVADQSGVPFLLLPGSEFVELFIGVGAARVRDLFERAKKQSPCIIFIDEIDAVGKKRGSSYGNDEREQTLNQLLTEMDGFDSDKGVIIIGATNRVDVLDAALLRPGRFDRQVYVGLPDLRGRLAILNVHAKNKTFSPDVSLETISKLTPNFSGADLENLLNESAILTTRGKKTVIGKNEVQAALDRIIGGLEGGSLPEGKIKRLLAYHEVGHAIAATLLKDHEDVEKVTLLPRGKAKGLTWFEREESESLISRDQLLAKIIVGLSGRAAEESVFGKAEITTAASSDLRQVTNIAKQMVKRFGMSQLGPRAFNQSSKPGFLNSPYSDKLQAELDNQIQLIITSCYEQALYIIQENRIIINVLVEKLIRFETIDGEAFRAVVNDFTKLPEKSEYSYVYKNL